MSRAHRQYVNVLKERDPELVQRSVQQIHEGLAVGILADIRRDDQRAADVIRRLGALMRKSEPEPQLIDVNEVVRVITDIRDPALNHNIQLPIVDRDLLTRGVSMAEMRSDPSLDPRVPFGFLVGQPREVREAFLDAMGFADSDSDDPTAAFAAPNGPRTSRRAWA